MSCTCGLSICSVCFPSCSCFDVFCGGTLTGAVCTPSVCVPVSGLPGSPCPASAPNLCNLPLTNPGKIQCLEPITSPCSHGAIDTPPCTCRIIAPAQKSRCGIANGAGTATSQFTNRPNCSQYQNVGSLLNRWGTAFTNLLGGRSSYYSPSGSYIAPRNNNAAVAPTSFGFLIFALVAGFILWKLAFSD